MLGCTCIVVQRSNMCSKTYKLDEFKKLHEDGRGMDNTVGVSWDGELELIVVLSHFAICIGQVFSSIGP